MNERNLTLLTDLYELTMMNGYFDMRKDERVVFDVFYRKNPSNGGYAIVAGLEQVIEYIKNLHFEKSDIEYLRELNLFDEKFLNYLENFKFTGNIYAIKEGTVVFPMEPLLKIEAPIIEAQLVETAILNIINHESLIATKASRVCEAAKGDAVMEFGLRRAQGADAGIYGARAAIIGGCSSTSNVLAGKEFNIPVSGTHAHSFIMSFPNEYEAFKKYAKLFPNNATLLVDTYDTLNSGVPNAIKVFKELKEEGKMPKKFGIRLDSGDLAYLSKKARMMLDEAGFSNATICASNDLDEYLIESLKEQDAKINLWGVGTSLITSKDCPSFGGVYKLAAIKKSGVVIPKIKLSEDTIKITNPGDKQVFRFYDKKTGKIRGDIIGFINEKYSNNDTTIMFDPIDTFKRKELEKGTYTVRELLEPIFINGKCVYKSDSVMNIRNYCIKEKETLSDENKRFVNPHPVHVDLSYDLWDLKNKMIDEEKKLVKKRGGIDYNA